MPIAGNVNADALSEGENIVGGSLGLTLATWNNAATFSANFERGFADDVIPGFNFGAGALVQYTNFSSFNSDFSVTGIAAQGNLHYDLGPDSFQPYAGLLLGYNIFSADTDTYASSLGIGGQVGGRYYFSDDLAATLRLNSSSGGFGGYSVVSAGVDYKF